MKRWTGATAAVFATCVLSAASLAEADEVTVLSAVGMRQVLLALKPPFERATGHTLTISFESSGVIVPRVEAGATADVVLLPRAAIDRLTNGGKVEPGSATDIASAIIGVAVRAGAAKPDISTPDAFRRALLAAKAIARADPAQGGSSAVHIAAVAARLGIAAEVNARSVITFRADDPLAAPGYTVAGGRADIALHQMQELLAVPGIDIVGPLPGDLQQTFLFSAGIMTAATARTAGLALVDFLRTPAAAAVIAAKGMQPAMITIVALGDSTTAGTPAHKSPLEAPPDGSGNVESQYAYWLMQARRDWQVLNRGVNGERSDQIRARFARDAAQPKPAVVVIIAGVNDVYQGRPAAAVERELEAIYDAARAAKIAVVAGSIVPFNSASADQNARMHAVNDWIRGYAAAHPADVVFCDTRAAVAAPGQPDRLVSSPDDLHPSPDGYRRMAAALEPAITAALSKAK